MKISILTLIALIFIFNGCGSKTEYITKIVYKKQPKYEFTKIRLDGLIVKTKKSTAIVYDRNFEITPIETKHKLSPKSKITLSPKAVQQLCTYTVLDGTDPIKSIITEHYDYQIDKYNNIKDTNEQKN